LFLEEFFLEFLLRIESPLFIPVTFSKVKSLFHFKEEKKMNKKMQNFSL